MTPSPRPHTDVNGNLSFDVEIPRLPTGQYTILVQVGEIMARDGFKVIAVPTPTPKATAIPTRRPTATPVATQVPKALIPAGHGDAQYTVNVPVHWTEGQVTFIAKPHTGSQASWAERNTIIGARRFDIKPLQEAGVALVGTYFKERYSSEGLCGTRGFVVIRETALVLDFREVGIALHVDVCEADLPLEAEPGINNEEVSNNIIRSLWKQK